jgi:hypothetical protein
MIVICPHCDKELDTRAAKRPVTFHDPDKPVTLPNGSVVIQDRRYRGMCTGIVNGKRLFGLDYLVAIGQMKLKGEDE